MKKNLFVTVLILMIYPFTAVQANAVKKTKALAKPAPAARPNEVADEGDEDEGDGDDRMLAIEEREEESSDVGMVLQVPLADVSFTSEINDEREGYWKQNVGDLNEAYIMLETAYLNVYIYPFKTESNYVSISQYFLEQSFEAGVDYGLHRSGKEGHEFHDSLWGTWLAYYRPLSGGALSEFILSYSSTRGDENAMDENEEVYQAATRSRSLRLQAGYVWPFSDRVDFLTKVGVSWHKREIGDDIERAYEFDLIPFALRVVL